MRRRVEELDEPRNRAEQLLLRVRVLLVVLVVRVEPAEREADAAHEVAAHRLDRERRGERAGADELGLVVELRIRVLQRFLRERLLQFVREQVR